jgi:hypothetical protein
MSIKASSLLSGPTCVLDPLIANFKGAFIGKLFQNSSATAATAINRFDAIQL